MKFLKFTILLLLATACSPASKMRYPPERWVRDHDRVPIEKPDKRSEYKFSDILNYQFFYQLERLVDIPYWGGKAFDAPQEALNTNNFDEVADSTWFTNRLGRRKMSLEEIRRGPNRGVGPDGKGPWTVISGKTVGGTPGLIIKDTRGDRYLIKFEPLAIFDLATAAEMISTKLFYAFGFNVPENYLVQFKPEILKIAPDATHKKGREKVPLTQEDLHHLFKRVPQKGDGIYRALASKFISGEPLGPMPFQGRRRGDKNDRIPHQHRRELRGYRVFAAYLNHTDSREANSFDAFMETGPGDKGYVQHYLIDFGSTLGSGTIAHKEKLHLDDYYLNYGKTAGSLLTFGAYQPNWEKAHDPEILEVGLFESKAFNPEKWKPPYPNPAFLQMTFRDAFWASKILMRLSDEQIAAVVQEAAMDDPRAEAYMIKTLIERRDKTGLAWFSKINPLDNFELLRQSNGVFVKFDDLMITHGLAPQSSAIYEYRLKQDNLISWRKIRYNEIWIPHEVLEKMKSGKPYYLQIKTLRDGVNHWDPVIDVVLKKEGELKIIGLNRRYRH